MSRLTPSSLERARAAADIVEVVSAHTELRKRGARYLGLCPFHDERTPSFSVDPAAKLYYCFGCQAGGDVFSFLQEKEGLDFREAVERIADRYGVELSYDSTDPREDQRRRARERVQELLTKAADFYARYLWESNEAARAAAYLEGRGLGREVLVEFGVGYAPSAWDRLLTGALQAGYDESELQAAGLVQKGRRGGFYDRFRSRIMFPLRDPRGRVLGFGARATRESQVPKYVNSPESVVYQKRMSLFGIDRARAHASRAGEVVVVEGYTDVLALHQAGIENAVASMGTALTDEQLGELGRLARVVLLAFDADRSGQEAMLRVQRAAAARRLVLKVIRLPDDKDPCDLLRKDGRDSFVSRMGEAISFLEFQVETVLGQANIESPAGKDGAVRELAPIFAAADPSAERDEQLRRVADRLDLSEHLLTPLMARTPQRAARSSPGGTIVEASGAATRGERWERIFLAMCVSHGDQGRRYLERLQDDYLSSEVLRRARRWLLANFGSPPLDLQDEDPDLAQAVSEVVVRAASQPREPSALEIGFLGLERRKLEREGKAAAQAGDFERQRELSRRRNEVTEEFERLMEAEERFPAGDSTPSVGDARVESSE